MNKKRFNYIAKFLNTEELNEGELLAVVATDSTDRHEEQLDIQGLETAKYMDNPVVAWAHQYDKKAIAKTIELKKVLEDGVWKLVAKMKFAIETSDFAREIYNLYKGGYMSAFSIGFIPMEMQGNRFTKSEMLEYSAVLVPANAEALSLAVGKGVADDDFIKKELNELKISKKEIKKEKGSNMNLKELLAKGLANLTAEEKAFVREHFSELNDEQKSAFRDVFEQKSEESAILKALDAIAKRLEALDAPEAKKLNSKEQKGANEDKKELSKEEKLKLWLKAAVTKDFSEFNAKVKDGMNETNTSHVIPPTDFIAEVLRLEDKVGVARQFATLRSTNRTSITMILGNADVAIYETSEEGVKKGTKVSYNNLVMTWRKFAAVAPVTEELLEDSAIDIWNDLTQRFARAYAKKEDELVFTDATYGILNLAGVNEVEIAGDSINDVTGDDLIDMQTGVPVESMNNGRYYMHRTIFGVVRKLKDKNDQYLFQPGLNGPASGTICGSPYSMVDIMPTIADDAPETAFAVFGDLKNTVLGERTVLKAKIFDSGVVQDADEEDINLITQDEMAMRVVKRMNARTVFASAYSVLKTGAAAS